MSDLKPCPCGCSVDFITMQQVGTRHLMKCDCGWTSPIRANKERAIAAWNTRAPIAVTDAMVEAALRSWNLTWDAMEMNDDHAMRAALVAALAQMEGQK